MPRLPGYDYPGMCVLRYHQNLSDQRDLLFYFSFGSSWNYFSLVSWARCISSTITSVSKMHYSRYCGHYIPVSRKLSVRSVRPIRGAKDLSSLTAGFWLLISNIPVFELFLDVGHELIGYCAIDHTMVE